jgi:hypothetical protein
MRIIFCVVGGNAAASGSTVYQPTAEMYDPATGMFSAIAATLPNSSNSNDFNSIPSVTFKDGRVLIPDAPSLLYKP